MSKSGKISDREKWPTVQVYKITYPAGKIYIGCQPYLSYRYFGSQNRELLHEDFQKLPPEVRRDYTCRKEILWKKENGTDQEMFAMENRLIVEHESNNPDIGYNRRPKYKKSKSLTNDRAENS